MYTAASIGFAVIGFAITYFDIAASSRSTLLLTDSVNHTMIVLFTTCLELSLRSSPTHRYQASPQDSFSQQRAIRILAKQHHTRYTPAHLEFVCTIATEARPHVSTGIHPCWIPSPDCVLHTTVARQSSDYIPWQCATRYNSRPWVLQKKHFQTAGVEILTAPSLSIPQKRSARKWKEALLAAECRMHSACSVSRRPGGPAAWSVRTLSTSASLKHASRRSDWFVWLFPACIRLVHAFIWWPELLS